MQKHLQKAIRLILLLVLFLNQSCGIYSFTGASIPAEMKTVSVQFFENNAPLVVPYLSQQFTEALKERIRNQTRLSMIRTEGDGDFTGNVTEYSIRPVSVQSTTDRAGLERLTITINVKYTNILKPELSFEKPFTRFADFAVSGSKPFQVLEPDLIKEINKQLTEDIFNAAFANWN